MATKTETEIHDIKVEIATLKTQVETLNGGSALLSELTKQVAVLQTQVAELAKAREVWGQRGFTILQLLLAAGAGALLTYLLRPKS